MSKINTHSVKSKSYTITIGIPAHNEEKNIRNLVQDCLRQVLGEKLILKQIIISSDNSLDKTNQIVQELHKQDARILLVNNLVRGGKPARINQIFSLVTSDCVIILDADVRLVGDMVINNLLQPMLSEEQVVLTSGHTRPFAPITLAEHLSFAKYQYWQRAKSITKNADMYYCDGPIRAFRRSLYHNLRLPSTIAEDVYPYLYCMANNLKFRKVLSAEVLIHLPATIGDYVRQMSRAIGTENVQQSSFPKEFLKKHYTIGYKEKFTAFIYSLWHNPVWTFFALAILIPIKIQSLLFKYHDAGIWQVASSTKK